MMKKIFFVLNIILFISPAYSVVNSKLILESKAKGKESISIAVTPLTSKKQIKELKENVETNKNYLNTLRPKLISKNKSRPPRTKFKGPAEDIYKAYAKSVVFIANYKKNGSGSGFVINHKGKKNSHKLACS